MATTGRSEFAVCDRPDTIITQYMRLSPLSLSLVIAALLLVLMGMCHCFVAGEPSRSPAATNRARWMQDRLDSLGDRPLKRLVLPAWHDSAMYQSGLLKLLARTQDLTIYQQLSYGIRYFDLRPQWHDGKLSIHHGAVTGPSLAEVLDDVRRFAAEGHRELVILKFSHYEGFQTEAYKGLVKQIKASLGPWLYTSLPRGRRLADVTLAEYVRHAGAILVLCDGSYPLDNRSEGIWVYRDWDSRIPSKGTCASTMNTQTPCLTRR